MALYRSHIIGGSSSDDYHRNVPSSSETTNSFPEELARWSPLSVEILQQRCNGSNNNGIVDIFPPSFEADLYQKENVAQYMKELNSEKQHILVSGDDVDDEKQLAATSVLLDENHYQLVGRFRGWKSSRGQTIDEILNSQIVPALSPGKILEIGPYVNPRVVGANVQYFDVLNADELLARATRDGFPIRKQVPIDYVNSVGDLSIIPSKSFVMVTSSHAVEHQLDLIRHLQSVSNLLQDGGVYFLRVPDKRFCFDHYVTESTIADVLDDYIMNVGQVMKNHKLRSVVEHRALTTHNDASRHWVGDHGLVPSSSHDGTNLINRVKAAWNEWSAARDNNNTYVDVHNYQFTPQGFATIVDTLYELNLIDFHVSRLYETLKDNLEFGIVLRKCAAGAKEEKE